MGFQRNRSTLQGRAPRAVPRRINACLGSTSHQKTMGRPRCKAGSVRTRARRTQEQALEQELAVAAGGRITAV
jgi:hypothetical protein